MIAPVESIVAEALVRANVAFTSPDHKTGATFLLVGGLVIDCIEDGETEDWYTDGTLQAIIIIGSQAALRFAALLGVVK